MRLLAGLLIAAALAACAKEPASPAAPPSSPSTGAARGYSPVALTTDWTREPQLVTVSHQEWQRELEQFRGRIVVVDNWATWCAPCIERFPAMVEMGKTWAPSGVTFVTLSLDDRDDDETAGKVKAFLASQDARMPNYLMDEIIPDAFDRLGLLGIPAVFVYDADGTLTHRLTGDDPNQQFTEADVDAAVRDLLEKRAERSSRPE
jgi:thiol-disulfide isomerase/thioredoxin